MLLDVFGPARTKFKVAAARKNGCRLRDVYLLGTLRPSADSPPSRGHFDMSFNAIGPFQTKFKMAAVRKKGTARVISNFPLKFDNRPTRPLHADIFGMFLKLGRPNLK